ncbi:bifunctional glycosyltransferase/CDP-glycerol:glycerophosphate glycerophosphotransferase [Brevibacterium oceani]|uniref:bifunctional glycosyltransferase/CDP-glycerol:glycerophosphate glycerophosphotransferase n=1 Tax=Brevibacterium oceani TaxID=358099 RepID=UPI0015E63DD3|nr:CDP-glycerol glycerophosphotransferase family protein [Brevibacterium oceani]
MIVPAYNVDGLLEECVQSIIEQTYKNWEMFIIDDGSPGRTGEIADYLAERDPRITVVHQENQGLGAARNTGIRESTAPYITFIDSDDVIPPGAFFLMMSSLEASGSDVVIGSMDRFNSARRWTPFWVDLVHDENRFGITAVEHPPVMWDVFACNKVFKRSVWNELVGEFPVGTLYEDQECTAKLFVGGATLDILTDVVYHWRLRDDGQSITQNKAEIRDLEQRLAVAEKVRRVVEDAPQSFVDYWYTKCLGEDFFYYYREVPRADDRFFEVLQDGVRRFYEYSPEKAIEDIVPERRWLAYLASYGTRQQLTELLVAFDSYRTYYSAYSDGGRLLGVVPGLESLFEKIPDRLKVVYPWQLSAQAVISSIDSGEDGSLVIGLFAYVPNLAERIACAARLVLSTGEVLAVSEARNIPGAVGHLTADPYNEHPTSHFEVVFSSQDVDNALRDLAATESEQVDVVFSVKYGDQVWEIRNPKRLSEGSSAWPLPGEITEGGNRFVIMGDPRTSTSVKFLKPRFQVRKVRLADGHLSIEAQLQVGNGLPRHELFDLNRAQFRLRAGSEVVKAVGAEKDGNAVIGHLPVAGLRGPSRKLLSETLALELVCDERFSAPLGVAGSLLQQFEGLGRLVPTSSSYGYLQLDVRRIGAEVRSVRVDQEAQLLVVTGYFYSDPKRLRTFCPSLTLVGRNSSFPAARTSWSAENRFFEVAFDLGSVGAEPQVLPAASDEFILQALLPTGQPTPATMWVPVEKGMAANLPAEMQSSTHSLRLVCTGRSRALKVIVTGAGNTRSFNSAFSVRRCTIEKFSDPDREIVPGTMFFESFGGNTVSGSPKEIDRVVALLAPKVQRVWSVRDNSVSVPEGARRVVVGSEEWLRHLATSEVLVNNNNFPHYFKKANRQRYIQTWHGTPLKRIGNDVPGANLSLRYRALMQKEAEHEWDLLLAQSPWAAERLAEAFAYEGPIFAQGYPRNDALNDPARVASARLQLNALYGISDAQTVVLYAPTWRDNLKDADGRYSRVDYLGLDSVRSKLGEDYVIFYRGHANSVFSENKLNSAGVIDVSLYPDVNDLISASDMLLTDYSSIMFDYVVTGKPIAFIAPDLEQYRDETRGFYFDFESQAPGPVLRDGPSAVRWIKGEDRGSHEYSEKYASFVEKFAPMDDGRAVERLIREYSSLLGLDSIPETRNI